MPNIVCNQDHHYFIDGKRTPGVHEIMQAAGLIDFSGVSPIILKAAQDFGRAVHKGCQLWDLNDLDIGILSGPLLPYLESWKKFKVDYGIVSFVGIETMIHSAKWGYCGTLDRVWDTGRKIILADIKTGTGKNIGAGPQTAAYKESWQEMTGFKVAERWEIILSEEGYKVNVLKEPSDWTVFLSCLNIWKWKQNH